MKTTSLRSIIALTCLAAGMASAEATYTFNIQTQSLSDALKEFASQSGLQVVYFAKIAANQSANPVAGALSAEDALRRLLGSSNLVYERMDEKTIAIRSPGGERPRATNANATGEFRKTSAVSNGLAFMHIAQAGEGGEQSQPVVGDDRTPAGAKVIELEEVVVTGSHIRGAPSYSSPMITFDRQDIEASGYSTTQQLMQSLPQNLSNVSDTTFYTTNGGSDGIKYDGAGINLRGLGSESTLVLVNGRRLAAAGTGDFVDVSLIPLSAIERVEVLTDGASAIYGSDAIGGVVNFVLRKDFEGAETRVRYGSVTQGSHDEWQAGQMLGHSWESGRALVSYEYFRRSPLDAADRDFIQPIGNLGRHHTIPGQKRGGAFAMLSQRLSDRAEVFTDLFFGQRETIQDYVTGGFAFFVENDVRQYGGSLGMSLDLIPGWQLRFVGQHDRNDSNGYSDITSLGIRSAYDHKSRVSSLDLTADGRVADAPGGDVRIALGGQFRDERFTDYSFTEEFERDVTAVFAEVRVPWVSERNRRQGLERLELTLAGRLEEYSDFGSTFNPKIGLAWAPVTALNLRGTWGTSFKAPLLVQTSSANNFAYVYPSTYELPFLDASGNAVPTVWVLGSTGKQLRPEESTNWTLGFDLEVAALPALDLSVTYFHIDYEERIRTPTPSGYDVRGVLADSTYAGMVTRNPSPADVVSLLAGLSEVTCAGVCPEADEINAIVDSRLRNLAAVRQSGLDMSLRYGLESRMGTWGIGLSGQYLLSNRERLVRGAPESNELNNVWRPVDLRLRSSISLTSGPFNAATFINYTDGYSDRRAAGFAGPLQRSTVASWTTVDLTLQLDLGKQLDLRRGATTLALSAINVFDRDPPFVGSDAGLYFDGVNASPLGRFVSAQLSIQW